MAGYSSDLAFIHHDGFTQFIRNAAPALLACLRRHGIRDGLVVDLGCGSGVWANLLTESGYRAIGIDISPSMIRLARRNAPNARFFTGSLRDFQVPECRAVTSIGECINYGFDPDLDQHSLAAFFHHVYEALLPGGIFAFDFAEPGLPAAPAHFTLKGDDWAVLVEKREDRSSRTLARLITSFRRQRKLYRRTDEIHLLRLYPRAQLLRALERAGFKAEAFDGYGKARLPAAHAAIIARKPARSPHSTRAAPRRARR